MRIYPSGFKQRLRILNTFLRDLTLPNLMRIYPSGFKQRRRILNTFLRDLTLPNLKSWLSSLCKKVHNLASCSEHQAGNYDRVR